MWLSLLLLVAAACLASGDEPGPRGRLAAIIEPRLGASAIRIGRLERELEDIQQKIEDAEKVDPHGFIDDFSDRLTLAEKPVCEKNRVQCGQYSRQCISSLLMCDGRDDCHNGYDEKPDVCDDGPAKAGNVFAGTVRWTKCAMIKDHPFSINIIAVRKANYFGARLFLRAVVSSDFYEMGHKEYQAKGYYVPGLKKLVLLPLVRKRNDAGIMCHFNHGDNKRAECILGHQATLNVCATSHIVLQK